MNVALVALTILTGCAASPMPPDAPNIASPSAPAAVVKQYQDAAKKEVPAITAPQVTPNRVRTVHEADMDARKALERLEAQGQNPTAETLEAARDAVRRLSDTLKYPPK